MVDVCLGFFNGDFLNVELEGIILYDVIFNYMVLWNVFFFNSNWVSCMV